jgi:hypothetical protein
VFLSALSAFQHFLRVCVSLFGAKSRDILISVAANKTANNAARENETMATGSRTLARNKGRRSRGRVLPPRPQDGLATILDAAEFLSVSDRQVYRMIDAGILVTREIGKGTRGARITWESLHRFVAGETPAAPLAETG